jgi:uncharacterized protein YkwD
MTNMDRLILLHNNQREKTLFWSLPFLIKDSSLMNYAQKWSNYMADRNDLKHGELKNILSLGFSLVGENIAAGQKTEEKVMESWIKSIGHKRNIMNKNFNSIGCGYSLSKYGVPYWCVCFGKK